MDFSGQQNRCVLIVFSLEFCIHDVLIIAGTGRSQNVIETIACLQNPGLTFMALSWTNSRQVNISKARIFGVQAATIILGLIRPLPKAPLTYVWPIYQCIDLFLAFQPRAKIGSPRWSLVVGLSNYSYSIPSLLMKGNNASPLFIQILSCFKIKRQGNPNTIFMPNYCQSGSSTWQ